MLVLDERGAAVADPDGKKGRLEPRERNVVHRYVVDVPEETHEEVVAEYPETGGRDVEIVVDVEERGHWETRLEGGELVEFDGAIPDGTPRELELDDVQQYMLYVPYAPEELEEIARAEEERGRMEAEAAEREALVASVPERMGRAEAALGELGAMAASGSSAIEELAAAVAELGALVAGE